MESPTRRERPCSRTAEQCDELAPPRVDSQPVVQALAVGTHAARTHHYVICDLKFRLLD